jgi:hypothetical protein
MSKLLIDFGSALRLQLTESNEPQGRFLVARGEFGRADIPTQNRRMYPRKLWEREIQKIYESLAAGKVMGELDHPADGKTSLKRVSHLMTGLRMTDDGVILGEAKILLNEHGNQLRSILEAGGAVGVSSRGMGSTAMGEGGMEVVQEDYAYMTHDFVADPAVLTSYPKFTTEVRWIEPESVLKENEKKEKDAQMEDKTAKAVELKSESNEVPEIQKPEEVKAPEAAVEEPKKEEAPAVTETPAAEANAEANVKEEAAPAAANLEEEKQKLRESIKAELLADPTFAAAHIALEDIKKVLIPIVAASPAELDESLKVRDTQIAQLQEENKGLVSKIDEIGLVANRLAATLHYERSLAKLGEDREEVLSYVSAKKFENVDQVEAALTEAKKKVAAGKAKKKQAEMDRKRIEARMESRIKAAEDRTHKLEQALRESVETSKSLGMRLYVEECIRDNPNAAKIRKLCEGKTERNEIDSIVKRFAVAPVVNEDYNLMRRRFERVKTTNLVEDQVKKTGTEKRRSTGVEGVIGEIADLTPGATQDQIEALM